MEELKIINERTRWLMAALVFTALLMVATVLLISEAYFEFLLGITAVICFIYLGHTWILRWRDKSILACYAAIKSPIFEVQTEKHDKWVWQRAEIHRLYLQRSRNELYETKKIDVVEVYMNDPAIRFTEPTEEYWLRVEDFKRDYLDNWAKKVAPNDENWRKIHLHNQVLELPKSLQAI